MKDYSCVVRIRVERTGGDIEHAFGKGTAQLLLGVAELHSLNKAAKRIGMAYSKAWKSINFTEEHLGFALIERNGQRGSELTERGRKFLETYHLAEAAAMAAVDAILQNSIF